MPAVHTIVAIAIIVLAGFASGYSPAAQGDRSAVSGPTALQGAIGRMCEGHHGSDVCQRDVSRVQGGVDLLGNLVVGPTPPEIVADEAPHPGERSVVVRRPSEAGGAQLGKVCI